MRGALERLFRLADRVIVAVLGERWLRPGRFLAVGASGALVGLAAWRLMVALGLHELLGGALGYSVPDLLSLEAGLLWNFALHEAWTFADLRLPASARARTYRLAAYHATSLLGWAVVVGLHVALVSRGAPPLPAYVAALFAGFASNYTLARLLAWNERLPWLRPG